jgi:hypothetical protein
MSFRIAPVALATLALTLSAFTASALEATSHGNDMQVVSNLGLRLDSLQALLTAAINELTHRVDVCRQKGMLYAPTSASKDADGCVAGGSGAGAVCANDLKFYAPGNAGADGCVDAIVINQPKTATANLSADTGSGAGVFSSYYNMTPIIQSNAQSVVAVISICQGFTAGEKTGWCGATNDTCAYRVAIPNLSVSTSGFTGNTTRPSRG